MARGQWHAEIERLAATTGAEASRLSQRLEFLQDQLRALHYKIDFGVSLSPMSNENLWFTKHKGEWKLVLSEDIEGSGRHWTPISDASIQQKITAARIAPVLVTSMLEQMQEQAEGLREAHEALDAATTVLKSGEGA